MRHVQRLCRNSPIFPTPPPARSYRRSHVIQLPPDASGERSVALARSRASGITWEVTFRSVLSYVTFRRLHAPSTALFRRSFHTRRSSPFPCVPSTLPSTRSSRRRAVCARDGSRHLHQRPSRTSFRHVLSYVPLSAHHVSHMATCQPSEDQQPWWCG